MSADEFNETFALCHFLPGPNIVNLSMVFGSRLRMMMPLLKRMDVVVLVLMLGVFVAIGVLRLPLQAVLLV